MALAFAVCSTASALCNASLAGTETGAPRIGPKALHLGKCPDAIIGLVGQEDLSSD